MEAYSILIDLIMENHGSCVVRCPYGYMGWSEVYDKACDLATYYRERIGSTMVETDSLSGNEIKDVLDKVRIYILRGNGGKNRIISVIEHKW